MLLVYFIFFIAVLNNVDASLQLYFWQLLVSLDAGHVLVCKYKVWLWFYVRILRFSSNSWRDIYCWLWMDRLVIAGYGKSTSICFEVKLFRDFVLWTVVFGASQAVLTLLRFNKADTGPRCLASLKSLSNAAFCNLFVLLQVRQQLSGCHFRVSFRNIFGWSLTYHIWANIILVYITHTLFFQRSRARSFLISFLLFKNVDSRRNLLIKFF